MIVIIPSCFSVHLDYLTPLIDAGARFFVIDDTEGSIKINHPQFEVVNWGHRTTLLGKNHLAIPKGNGACRNLGFLLAWKESNSNETIIALDDDCMITEPNFVETVKSNLSVGIKPLLSGNSDFYNLFELYKEIDLQQIFPRGFPYPSRMNYAAFNYSQRIETEVHFNLGLWTGVLDINAVDRLGLESNKFESLELKYPQVVLPKGVKASLCAANMHFRKELIPAIFQPPMNIQLFSNGVVNRMGDIWGGYCLKNLMDINNHYLSIGEPLVWHRREGNYLKNVGKEIIAHQLNNEMIDLYDACCSAIVADTYLNMMLQLKEQLRRYQPNSSLLMKAYLTHYIDSLTAWNNLLS